MIEAQGAIDRRGSVLGWCANGQFRLERVDATYPFTSSPFRSSASAAEVEVAMSSDCGFWSRAIESDCDVITAIRARF